MIILKLSIVFAVIFSANIVGSKIVEALPSFPPEILNQLLKNKSLINGILTQEQITEVEKNPAVIMTTCHSRVIGGLDPGKICDAAFKYLSDKCERLDNVLPYCLTLAKGTVVGYLIDRLDQMQNLQDKPSLSEIYNTWKLTRDNPNCSVEAGLLICP
jgi:uncharacterized membrane protein YqgA involved in biofilm formation